MKRTVALFLTVLLLFGAAAPAALVSSGTDGPSAATLQWQRTFGAVVSLLGQMVKTVTFTDESRIK